VNTLRAGSSVHYKLRPEWGLGRVQWITRGGLLMVRFVNAYPMYEGEFAAGELEDAAPLEVPA
jgi:hypothetical protein